MWGNKKPDAPQAGQPEVKNFQARELIGDKKLLKFASRMHGFALVAAAEGSGVCSSAGCSTGSSNSATFFDPWVPAADGSLGVDLAEMMGSAGTSGAACSSAFGTGGFAEGSAG